MGEGCFSLLMHLKSLLHEKSLNKLCIGHTIHCYVPVLGRYVCGHAASPRISARSDLSTTLNFSIRQEVNREIKPQQTSALELLLVCYFEFCILLIHHCTLYLWNVNYAMCAQPCPIPLKCPNQGGSSRLMCG